MKGFDTSNLERSERVAAAIILKLAETGFQSSVLEYSELGLDEDLERFFDMTVRWLIAEQLVQVGNFSRLLNGPSGLIEPTLTSKGIELLGQSIVLRDTKRDAGEAVYAIAKGDRSFWQVGDLIGSILGGLTKSMGG